jgi:hypothetical protein
LNAQLRAGPGSRRLEIDGEPVDKGACGWKSDRLNRFITWESCGDIMDVSDVVIDS